MLHNDLYNYLTTTAEVETLFPGGIHHESLPQDVETWPAMSFFQVSQNEFGEDMEGPNDEKLDQIQYQFDIVADSSAAAVGAADTFLGIFRNFTGTMTTTRIQMVALTNVTQLEERRGDKLRRRVSMDFLITIETE